MRPTETSPSVRRRVGHGDQQERTKSDQTTVTYTSGAGNSPQNSAYSHPSRPDCVTVFPQRTALFVFLSTLGFRLYYVSQPKNWWILHPDEVFQTLEVAHSEFYGYGFRSYEYLPPPSGENLSPAEEHELRTGMYSLRSFMLPRIFMMVLHVSELMGICHCPFLVGKLFHAAVTSLLPLSIYRFVTVLYKSHDIASIATILSAFSVHLTVFGTHTLINSFLSPVMFYAASYALEMILYGTYDNVGEEGQEKTSATPTKPSDTSVSHADTEVEVTSRESHVTSREKFIYIFSCFVLGLTCYMQPELFVVLVFLILPFILCVEDKTTRYKLVILYFLEGFLFGLIAGGLEDAYSYGEIFSSLRQWIRFQIRLFYSRMIAHPRPTTYYCSLIFLYNPSTIILVITLGVNHLRYLTSLRKRRTSGNRLAVDICLTGTFLALHLNYSLKGRKELRFLHDAVVIMLVIQASALYSILFESPLRRIYIWMKSLRCLLPWVLSVLYVSSTYHSFPAPSDHSDLQWIYPREWDSNHINSCLHFVSAQPNVTGVYLSRRFDVTGGFTLLHKDVPLLVGVAHDYALFTKSSRRIVRTVNPFGEHKNISLMVLSRISDYIDIHNHAYLYKFLLRNALFNYIIVNADDTFLAVGFLEVYRSETMRVFKRLPDQQTSTGLQKIAESLPVGTSADVLENEAKLLITTGCVTKAAERLEKVIQIDPARIHSFQMLAAAYANNKDLNSALRVQGQCKRVHGYRKCFDAQRHMLFPRATSTDDDDEGDTWPFSELG